jgi:hypothetical protein
MSASTPFDPAEEPGDFYVQDPKTGKWVKAKSEPKFQGPPPSGASRMTEEEYLRRKRESQGKGSHRPFEGMEDIFRTKKEKYSSRPGSAPFERSRREKDADPLPGRGEYEGVREATHNAFNANKSELADILVACSHEILYRIGIGRRIHEWTTKALVATGRAFKKHILRIKPR